MEPGKIPKVPARSRLYTCPVSKPTHTVTVIHTVQTITDSHTNPLVDASPTRKQEVRLGQ